MHEIMISKDFSLTHRELFVEYLPESINPEERRTLFTGADAEAILIRSLKIMKMRRSRTLTIDHIRQATKDIYKNNLADGN